MSYWINQPINTLAEDELKIHKDISKKNTRNLPKGFAFKTLKIKHLDEVCCLLNDHYIEDEQDIMRIVYSRDFLYWYLKYIPDGFMVGLIYKNKLVGMITAMFIDMFVYNKGIKMPYIDFLCVQKKIRSLGLAPFLMDEIKSRIFKTGLDYAFFTSMKKIKSPFCRTRDFVVPINRPKLKEIGFLVEDIMPPPEPDDNPLHLMIASDIESVVPKLNKSMGKYTVHPYFTKESAHHFLLPKKNIVYSFVRRDDDDDDVTDFIVIYKHYFYCLEKNKMVGVAQLAFYYYETMSLTELVTCMLDKLSSYGIDQLIFRNMAENEDINITKFSTYSDLFYYFFNIGIKETDASKIIFYPF